MTNKTNKASKGDSRGEKRNAPAIQIGGITGESRERLSRTIREVLDSGFKNHSSDTVLVKALDLVQTAFQVSGTTISGCYFGDTGK